MISRHVESGESLPKGLIEKLQKTRRFQAALAMLRQIEFALYDIRLHQMPAPNSGEQIQGLLDSVRAEVSIIKPPSYNRFQHAFTHIMAGGYAAGYYSYKWAEVLSADAFSAFANGGGLDKGLGKRYRDEILAVGGSRSAHENFAAFMGRPPKVDALLIQDGIMGASL